MRNRLMHDRVRVGEAKHSLHGASLGNLGAGSSLIKGWEVFRLHRSESITDYIHGTKSQSRPGAVLPESLT